MSGALGDSSYESGYITRIDFRKQRKEYGTMRTNILRNPASVTDQEIRRYIKDELDCTVNVEQVSAEHYVFEMYAGNDDELDPATVANILNDEHPMEAVDDALDELFDEGETRLEIISNVLDAMEYNGVDISSGGSAYELEQRIYDESLGMVDILPPIDHFLEREYDINIITKQRLEPEGEDELVEWLVSRQGFSNEAIEEARNGGYIPLFLEQCSEEVGSGNPGDYFTLCAKISLKDLIEITTHRRNNAGGAAITFDIGTMCGMFDPSFGSGGNMNLELDAPLTIPLDMIAEIMVEDAPEEGLYSLGEVFSTRRDLYCFGNMIGERSDQWVDSVVSLN